MGIGNLSLTTTSFRTQIQNRINSVNGSTTNRELAILYRASQLLTGLTVTTLQSQIQSRLNAVGAGTPDKEIAELAYLVGNIDNSNNEALATLLSRIAEAVASSADLATVDDNVDTLVSRVPSNLSTEIDTLLTRVSEAVATQTSLTALATDVTTILGRITEAIATQTSVDTIDANVDTILSRVAADVATASALATVDGNVDTLISRVGQAVATAAALATVDTNVDTLLTRVPSNLAAEIDQIDSVVDTIVGRIPSNLSSELDTLLTRVSANVATATALATVDSNVDSILSAVNNIQASNVFRMPKDYVISNNTGLTLRTDENTSSNVRSTPFWNLFNRVRSQPYPNIEAYRVTNYVQNSTRTLVNLTNRKGFLTHVVAPAASASSSTFITIIVDGVTYNFDSLSNVNLGGTRVVLGLLFPWVAFNSDTPHQYGVRRDTGFSVLTKAAVIPPPAVAVAHGCFIPFETSLRVDVRVVDTHESTSLWNYAGVMINPRD